MLDQVLVAEERVLVVLLLHLLDLLAAILNAACTDARTQAG